MSIATPAEISRVPFHMHARIRVLEAPAGQGCAEIPDLAELKNHLGTVHGGMLFALGEVAAATAVTHLLGADIARLRAITRQRRHRLPEAGARPDLGHRRRADEPCRHTCRARDEAIGHRAGRRRPHERRGRRCRQTRGQLVRRLAEGIGASPLFVVGLPIPPRPAGLIDDALAVVDAAAGEEMPCRP